MQTVVITGGTSGIGLATADIFLKTGGMRCLSVVMQRRGCKLNDN